MLTSDLATLHFAPTEVSRQNSLSEGIRAERVVVTGNTVIDALFLTLKKVREKSPEIPGLDPALIYGGDRGALVLITGHRRENFGEKLQAICTAITELGRQFPASSLCLSGQFESERALDGAADAGVRRVPI